MEIEKVLDLFRNNAKPGTYLIRKQCKDGGSKFTFSDCADGDLLAIKRLDGSIKYFKGCKDDTGN
jgi:hypothetical protein